VLENQIGTDAVMREIALFSIEKVKELAYTDAVDELYRLFTEETETSIRIPLLQAIGAAGVGDAQTVEYLNAWISAQNNSFKAGSAPNLQVFEAAVIALGKLKDPSSFPVLLTCRLLQYSGSISKAAEEALFGLEGDLLELSLNYLKNADIQDMEKAVDFFLQSDQYSSDDKVALADAALRRAVSVRAAEQAETAVLRRIRRKTVEVLRNNMAGESTKPVIIHFNMTVDEYERGFVTKSQLLEAIAALGAMGTDEAAERLSDYLDVLNNYTENIRPYDTQIMLAVVKNLNQLGKMAAYNSLLYASFLDYPNTVKTEIRNALKNLAN
jgi:HEAT repeat protein